MIAVGKNKKGQSLAIVGNPLAIRWQSLAIVGNSLAIRWQFVGNLLAIHWQSLAIRWQSVGNPLAIVGNRWQFGGNPLAIRWQTVGNPLAIVGNRWQSVGNPLAIVGNHWQFVGNPLAIRWQSVGNPMAICWHSVVNPLAIRWQSVPASRIPRSSETSLHFPYSEPALAGLARTLELGRELSFLFRNYILTIGERPIIGLTPIVQCGIFLCLQRAEVWKIRRKPPRRSRKGFLRIFQYFSEL